MLTTNLHITFSFVWSIAVANIVVALVLMVWCKQIAKIAFLPGHLIVPAVILFVFMGAWLGGASLGDWISCLVMGIIGFLMKRGGWPRPPLVLAVILGGLMEDSFLISMNAHAGPGWLGRPIVLVIFALILLTVFFAARGHLNRRDSNDVSEAGEGAERNPISSFPLALGLLVLFVWAALESLQWPTSVRQFPLIGASLGAVLVFFALINDFRACRQAVAANGSLAGAIGAASEKALVRPAASFFAYLIAMIAVMLVVGQKLALPLFVFAYLIRWGKYGSRLALGYAIAAWAFLVGFYDQIMHLFWHPSWLSFWLPDVLPPWLPEWLFI